jgi:hypothetical protein
MGLRERLIEIMEAVGNDAELARKAEVSRAAVSDWRSGNIKSLKAITAVNIQEKTGYSVRWLILGIGPKKVTDKDDSAKVGAITYKSQRLSHANEQKLLVVLRSFLDTDDEGKAEIVEAVKAVTGENGSTTGQSAKHRPSKPRRGSSGH